MKKLFYIILSVAVWVAIAVYFVFASNLSGKEKAGLVVQKVEIKIRDAGKVNVVSVGMVERWLKEAGHDFLNASLADVNTERVRETVAAKPFVKDVRVFSDMRGILHVELSQRRPIARFSMSNGYNFYYTDDDCILPIPAGSAMHVPVITGSFRMPFERGFFGRLEDSLDERQKKEAREYIFLSNLINFVKITAEDNFWGPQIVQIAVSQKDAAGRWCEPEVEIVPRVGNFVAGLGTLVDFEKKLDKLMLFYRNVLPYEGWGNYRYIDLKYDGQVVCTK